MIYFLNKPCYIRFFRRSHGSRDVTVCCFLLSSGKKVVLASVIQTKGSVPGKVGAKMITYKSGDEFKIIGTVGEQVLNLRQYREVNRLE